MHQKNPEHPNTCCKTIDLKRETDKSIIIVREFNLLVIDSTNRENICENTVEIKQTFNYLDLIDSTFYQTSKYLFFFSCVCGTFTKTNHIL